MHSREHILQIYQELADSFEQQHNSSMRDLFLMLAADAALKAGHTAEAELLRQRLLRLNPHHVLKPYDSFAVAVTAPDIQSYIEELRLKYPVEVAEEMLESVMPHNLEVDAADIPATMPPVRRPGPRPATSPPPPFNMDTADQAYRLRPEPEPEPSQPAPPPTIGGEPLKVYRVHPEAEAKPPAPSRPVPRPPERPARKPPPRASSPLEETMPPRQAMAPIGETLPPREPPSRPPPRPATPRAASPSTRRGSLPEPPRPAPRRPEPAPEEEKNATGAWVGVLLCGLVLLGGLALTFYTLFAQILPEGLFRR